MTITADTTLDFTLGDISDELGYRCRLENHAFEEADTILPISGDDLEPVAGGIELPFPFTFYGQTYTDAYVCTNGYMEFAGPSTSTASSPTRRSRTPTVRAGRSTRSGTTSSSPPRRFARR